ncbi:MAG: cytochrome c [Vicinamibacteria bacterium]|nr:cytochrome c [Vicinamibacteria bacterium]
MRKSTIIAVLAAALVTPTVRAADVTEADYQKAMKDTLAGMQAVGKTMREATGDLSGAVAGAKSIEAALASIDSFWAARKDDEAVKMNAAAREAAMAAAKAAESNDAAATGAAMKALQGACKACHDVHREQLPDKTYKIK